MTQVLYKTDKSNLESYGNVTAILLRQHAGSMETNGVVNDCVFVFPSRSAISLCMWNYLSREAPNSPHLIKKRPRG